MPPAVLVGALVAKTAVDLYSAKKSSDAAKKAAKQQEAAANRGLATNQQVYERQNQLMSPYVQAGNDSLARLMSQHWGTGGMAPGMSGTAMAFGQQVTPGSNYQAPPQGQMPPGLVGPGQPNTAMPRGGGPMPPGGMPGGRPNAFGGPPPMAQGGQGGGMVTIQAPTGETKQVPQQMAQRYLSADPQLRIVG